MSKMWLLVLILSIWSSQITENTQVNERKRLAKNAFEEENYVEAIGHYTYLLDTLKVEDEKIAINLAHSYYKNADTTQAKIVYQIASSHAKDPTIKSVASTQLGIIAHQKQELEQALTHFKQALREDPQNEKARYNYELLKRLTDQQNQQDQSQNQDQQDQNEQQQKEQDQQKNQENKDQQNGQDKQEQQESEQQKGQNEQNNKDQADNKQQNKSKESEEKEKMNEKGDEKGENKDKQDNKQQKEEEKASDKGKEKGKQDKNGEKNQQEELANEDNDNKKKGEQGDEKEALKEQNEQAQYEEKQQNEQGEDAQQIIKNNFKQLNMTPEKAELIFRQLEQDEIDFIKQQNKRKANETNRDPNKPNW